MSRRSRNPAPLSEAVLDAVAQRFRALAVPSRLRILNALMNGPVAMSVLAEVTGLAQSNLSRQVTELERAGCVARRRSGRTVEVAISDPSLEAVCSIVCGAIVDQARETADDLRGAR